MPPKRPKQGKKQPKKEPPKSVKRENAKLRKFGRDLVKEGKTKNEIYAAIFNYCRKNLRMSEINSVEHANAIVNELAYYYDKENGEFVGSKKIEPNKKG